MCLILFSVNDHPEYKLIVAANRDEFYSRPTMQAHWHGTKPDILAGKDLKAGGTWMGISETGRFAALTNYRNPADMTHNRKSRGRLVMSCLSGKTTPPQCASLLSETAEEYHGYNLLFGTTDTLWHYSNKSDVLTEISAGTYGLSNHLLDTPWPKVERGKKLLRDAVSGNFTPADIFRILADDKRAEDNELPSTGISLEMERILSSIFITSEEYGTRSSTLLTVTHSGLVSFSERTFNGPHEKDQSFSFRI